MKEGVGGASLGVSEREEKGCNFCLGPRDEGTGSFFLEWSFGGQCFGSILYHAVRSWSEESFVCFSTGCPGFKVSFPLFFFFALQVVLEGRQWMYYYSVLAVSEVCWGARAYVCIDTGMGNKSVLRRGEMDFGVISALACV